MTLQEHYNAIKSGKGNKDQFLKQARSLFPQYLNQYSDFTTATNVLKSKQIISEAAGGVISHGHNVYDWKKILEAKAEEKETSKEVKDALAHAFQPSDMKNVDNINFNEIMKGFFAEMYDEKNKEKTGDEIKAIVVKNLAKDALYYTKNGNFSTMGIGYTDEAPGLGKNTQPTDKKATVLGGNDEVNSESDVVKNSLVGSAKKNVQDTLGNKEAKTSDPKKVKEMPVAPQNASGVKKMATPGAEKRIKLKEYKQDPSLLKEGFGNDVGDKVYFKSEKLKTKYPHNDGYYGIIKDATPASDYNMLATYTVDVYDKNNNKINTIKVDWTDLSSKPLNENSDFKPRDIVTYNGTEYKITRISDDGRIYIKPTKFEGRAEEWVKAKDLKKSKVDESLEEVHQLPSVGKVSGGKGKRFVPKEFPLPSQIRKKFGEHIVYNPSNFTLYISQILFNNLTKGGSAQPDLKRNIMDIPMPIKQILNKSENYGPIVKLPKEYKTYLPLQAVVGKATEDKFNKAGDKQYWSTGDLLIPNLNAQQEEDTIFESEETQEINIVEQKLRSIIRNIIKEELNK